MLVAAAMALGPGNAGAAALCNPFSCTQQYQQAGGAPCGTMECCWVRQGFDCATMTGGSVTCPTVSSSGGCNSSCIYPFEAYDTCTVDQDCPYGMGEPEVCDNGEDDDYDGCVDEGCEKEYYGDPACTCTSSCAKPACGPVPDAECDPRKDDVREVCGDGKDNNCSGAVDEGCAPDDPDGGGPLGGGGPPGGGPPPPPPPGPGPTCGKEGGVDPLLLANRSAATNSFTDFSVSAITPLGVSRTWTSLDASYFGGPTGIFGNGWHHDWEATLSCSGEFCTVARGAREGLRFVKAEAVPSLDGAETWQLYRPPLGDTNAARRNLLVRRPAGEWVLFMSDGQAMHFATACDACGTPDAFCIAPEEGGVARLVRAVDARGNAVHVSYARVTGLLLGLTDDLGHSLELRSATACTDGLARELLYDGLRAVSYEYEGLDLTRAVDADGAVLRGYLYDTTGTGLLWSVLDEAGLPIVEFSYDAAGDAVGIADELTTMLVGYGDDGTVSVSESYGTNVSQGQRIFNSSGDLVSIAEGCSCGGAKTFTYVGGDLVCAKDAAGTITYDGRDALGRVIRHARYSGYACPLTVTLGTAFEEEWRSYGVVKPIAQAISLELDFVTEVRRKSTLSAANPASESWDYDPTPKAGDPLDWSCAEAPLPAGAVVCRHIIAGQVTLANGSVVLERHATFYSYDGRGRVTGTIGPLNLDRPSPTDVVPVEERLYWPDTETLARRGRLAEIRRYPSPTEAPLATTFDYDLFGLYRTWDPDGRFTTFIKDGRGRVRFVLESDGRSSETRYHDGEKPRLRISAGGEVSRTGYDSRGRVTAEERLSGDPDVPGATVSVLWGEYHQHDAAGNRVQSERRDGAGAVVWKQDREYDVQHRLVKESHPEVPGAARTWEYAASGFLTRTVDEEGRATTFTPEYIGRVKSVTRSGVDASGAPVSLLIATYDYQNYVPYLDWLKDAKGVYQQYRYDDFGRLETLGHVDFKGGTLTHGWDARGNLLLRKDTQVTVSHTYDGLDRRLTTTAYNAIDKATVGYTYRYDEEGAPGRLTSVVEPERTVRFRFDAGGRLESERQEEAAVAAPLVTAYRYDAGGRLSELVYPTGLRLLHDRDPVSGAVIALRNAETGEVYVGEVTRVAGGPLAGLAWRNGTTLAQGFNARWETTSVAAGPVGLVYSPTPAGDVGQIVEGGLALPFRYDFMDRLWESTGWFTHAMDGNGNRSAEWLEGVSLGYTYSWDRLRDASTPGTTPLKRYAFAYDYQTNVSGVGKYNATGTAVERGICLRHDPLGRLVTVGPAKSAAYVAPDATYCTLDTLLASVTARFKYDFRNRRVASWRAETGEWVYTVFDQGGQPLAELALTTDPANPWRPVREYVWLDGKPVAQIEHDAATGASRTYAVHTDAIGLPRALTSPTGAVVWKASVARPYGDVTEATVPDPETGKTVVTNLRLPGQYDERLLGTLGLQGPYYNWNRWYLPSVGRYLELDPIAKAGGFNTAYGVDWYNYADGNPLAKIDRTGKNAAVVVGAAGLGIGAVVLFLNCMEKCTGIDVERTTTCTPAPSNDKIAKCANYCVALSSMLGCVGLGEGAQCIITTAEDEVLK